MLGDSLKPKDLILKDADRDVFTQFGLSNNDELPHPHGSIFAKYIGQTPDGQNREMLWGVKKGTSYPPETHKHGHVLTIKHGSGLISIDGKEKAYAPGDIFYIMGNVSHGFIRVDETTVVSQKEKI